MSVQGLVVNCLDPTPSQPGILRFFLLPSSHGWQRIPMVKTAGRRTKPELPAIPKRCPEGEFAPQRKLSGIVKLLKFCGGFLSRQSRAWSTDIDLEDGMTPEDGRKNPNDLPKPEDFVFAVNAAKMNRADFGEFSSKVFVACDLRTAEAVDGDDDYMTLRDRLEERHGERFYTMFTIVGPKRTR